MENATSFPTRIVPTVTLTRGTGVERFDRPATGMKSRRAPATPRSRRSATPAGTEGACGDKPTKKTHLKYRCGDCGKAHMRKGWRAGRPTFQE